MPDITRQTLSRREVLGAGTLLAAPALLTRRAAAAESCVVGTWGGDYLNLLEQNIGKPIIAVVNSFTQFVPGHVHLKDLGQLVAREIEQAGVSCFRAEG